MRNIIILLLISTIGVAQCPVKGDKDNPKFQHADSLKNRSDSSRALMFIPIGAFFSPNIDDRNTFESDMYVQTKAYIKAVKYGGPECCNCHSKDRNDEDYHIDLIPDSVYAGKPMICEVNRFVRCITYDSLKALVGKQVTITGWLFFDEEHWANATHTNPNGTNIWRTTCWEIHPVIIIK